MRICTLSVVELKHMVMLSMYTNYFDKKEIEYDLIYMDRYHKYEKSNAKNIYRYEINGKNALSKAIGYFKFKSFAKRIMNKNDYDFIVTWNEYTAVLFEKYLMQHYKGKFFVNVRDLFDPDDRIRRPELLYPILGKVIKSSAITTVSSGKYIDYLPQSEKYLFVHSLNPNIMPEPTERAGKERPIVILYIGKIGYLEEVEKFLHAFGNDERYLLRFVGIGSDAVKAKAAQEHINNVEFVGMFESSETNMYLKGADVIYNLYGDRKACEKTALSNKLYYSVCLHIPILVYRNTYMYEVASSCGIAFAFDDYESEKIANVFYNWFVSLDREAIAKNCDAFIEEALKSRSDFEERLNDIISK